MTNSENHIENQPELNREIQEMISGTSIAWNKTKEEIWPEMLGKIEGNNAVTKSSKTIHFQIAKYAAAAVFILLLGISGVMYFYTKTIKTFIAQQTEVLLPDNSKVMVYEQSTLSYKPLLWEFFRTVKLEGKAYFEVQKGKNFEVVSRKGKTVVLGTQFDVYSRGNDYHVTCISGKVEVIESDHENEVMITGGQKAILKPDGNFEIVNQANTRPENVTNSQNRTIEDELNTLLSTSPAQAQPANDGEYKVPTDKQTVEKERAVEKKQEKSGGQNAVKEQNRPQNQAMDEVQQKSQPEAFTPAPDENKEQEQNQETANDQRSGNEPAKDRFKASLTPEQIGILENKQMSKDEKRKVFMQSLSPEQRQLLKEQNEARANKAGANRNEAIDREKVKEQQKVQTQEQMRESPGKENKEQQKQQNRETKNNGTPGGGNGSGSGSGS